MIIETRVVYPSSIEDTYKGGLYMTSKEQVEQTQGDQGVEWLVNEPYFKLLCFALIFVDLTIPMATWESLPFQELKFLIRRDSTLTKGMQRCGL